MDLARLEPLLDSDVVAQRVPLDQVARVEQERVPQLAARLADERRRPREAERDVALVAVVVIVDDVRVMSVVDRRRRRSATSCARAGSDARAASKSRTMVTADRMRRT